jgi:hypothetical protein
MVDVQRLDAVIRSMTATLPRVYAFCFPGLRRPHLRAEPPPDTVNTQQLFHLCLPPAVESPGHADKKWMHVRKAVKIRGKVQKILVAVATIVAMLAASVTAGVGPAHADTSDNKVTFIGWNLFGTVPSRAIADSYRSTLDSLRGQPDTITVKESTRTSGTAVVLSSFKSMPATRASTCGSILRTCTS